MDIPPWVYYVVGGSLAVLCLGKLLVWIDDQFRTITAKERDLQVRERELQSREAKVAEKLDLVKNGREALDILAKEKALGFPWLAAAYAEHLKLLDDKLGCAFF